MEQLSGSAFARETKMEKTDPVRSVVPVSGVYVTVSAALQPRLQADGSV